LSGIGIAPTPKAMSVAPLGGQDRIIDQPPLSGPGGMLV
jgi:hypothetical protein